MKIQLKIFPSSCFHYALHNFTFLVTFSMRIFITMAMNVEKIAQKQHIFKTFSLFYDLLWEIICKFIAPTIFP